MKNLSNKIKLILSSVLLAVFAAVTVAAVLLICNDAAHSVPSGVKLIMFLGGAVGCFLFFCFTINFAVLYSKEKAKDKQLIAAGLMQNPAEDVTRKPVKYDDEKGFNELEEHTNKFFENIFYPQGFLEFLKKYGKGHGGIDGETKKAEKVFTTLYIQRDDGEYFGIDDVYPQDGLLETNDYILTSAEYYTQFSNVLFFADDESGHCHFLLDYGRGGEPKVKYLDDETDVVRMVAESFAEFTEKLKECTYEEFYKLLDEYDKQHDKSKLLKNILKNIK